MIKVSTSILGIKDNFNQNIKKLDNTSTNYIHIDIMDGKFVDNTSFTFDEIKNVTNISNKPLDIHLMVENPTKYIEQYKTLNPEYITIHYEIENFEKYVKEIKDNNIKVGLSIKPKMDVDDIIPYISNVDLILIMSVEPGYGGQKFIESSLDKISRLKDYIKANKLNTIIEVDGGINEITSKKCIEAGVDILVSGNYITSNENYEEQINKLKS